MLSTPVVAIIRDGDEVVGVEVQKNGQKQNIKAKKGVVLATGGYESSIRNLSRTTQWAMESVLSVIRATPVTASVAYSPWAQNSGI